MVMLYLVIGDLLMKKSIMRKYEQLFDGILSVFLCGEIRIAYCYHVSDEGTHNKKSRTVHTGNRIINYYNPVLYNSIRILTAQNKLMEVKEGYEVSFALT